MSNRHGYDTICADCGGLRMRPNTNYGWGGPVCYCKTTNIIPGSVVFPDSVRIASLEQSRDALKGELNQLRTRLAATEKVVEAAQKDDAHGHFETGGCDLCRALADLDRTKP